MNFLETYDIAISILSPVHIGCGEDYEPTNYVIDGETLYAFDPARLLAELGQNQRADLARALDDRNPMLAAQRFFYRHREVARRIASHCAPVIPAAARYYANKIGQVTNQQDDGGKVINKLEIARTAFNPVDGLPILPGSSLKGAMRTAVLESLRDRQKKTYPLSDQDAAKNFVASRTASDMEKNLMAGAFQTDPMRLVKIGDAIFLPGSYKAKNAKGDEVEIERKARTILFQANRKKRPNQFPSRANIETLVECIPAGQPRAFRTRLGIERKARQGEGTPSLQLGWKELADACNAFYLERFKEEVAILEANKYVSDAWLKNARSRLVANGIWGKAIAEGRGFLLRLGRHSGAESVTVDAPRKIKILGENQPPSWKDQATTVWLAANEPGAGGGMWPFGWVFVQLR